MAEKSESEEQAVLQPQWFKRDHAKSLLVLLLLVLGLGLILLQFNVFLQTFTYPAPVFFKMTAAGALVEEKPLDVSNQPENLLFNWAVQVMMNINTFNFVNYNEVINKATVHFTSEGYKDFKDVLENLKIRQNVVDKKLVLSTMPLDAPHIVLEKVFAGRYMWKIQMPLLFKYSSVGYSSSDQYQATFIVARVPISESSRGIRILKYELKRIDSLV